MTVSNGTVTVSLAGGATVSAGANSSSTLTLSGTQAQINAALATLSYQGTSNFNGADSLVVLSTDANGATDSDSVAITVTAVNDAPVNTVPGAQTVNEDTALSISGVSVNDVDGNLSTTKLTVTNGAVTVSLAGGATISAGANSSSTLTLSGTQAQINAALARSATRATRTSTARHPDGAVDRQQRGDGFGRGCHHRQLGKRRAGEHGSGRADGERRHRALNQRRDRVNDVDGNLVHDAPDGHERRGERRAWRAGRPSAPAPTAARP